MHMYITETATTTAANYYQVSD